MADVNAAIDYVLKQEDSTLSGVITNVPGDAGGTTRYGITARYAPDLDEQGFFSDLMPADRALVMAQAWYAKTYAGPLYLDQIASQGIATALLSYAVNQGNREAVQCLQQAAIQLGASINADGVMGPATVAAINPLSPYKLDRADGQMEIAYYQSIVARNPSQAKFLDGWTNRAIQNESLT